MQSNNFITNISIDSIKSRTVEFLKHGDSQERYNYNLKLLGPEWKYSNTKVVYNINSNGFRAPEFDTIDWSNSIALVGCSYVFGEGVSEQDTLGAKISQLTGKNVINLGVPGASNESIFLNAINVQRYQPVKTIVMWTHMSRIFFYNSSGNALLLNSFNLDSTPYNLDLTDYLLDQTDLTFKLELYKDLLKNLLQDKVILRDEYIQPNTRKWWYAYGDETHQHLNFNSQDTDYLLRNIRFVNDCIARDIKVSDNKEYITAHFGPWMNEFIAKRVLADYEAQAS